MSCCNECARATESPCSNNQTRERNPTAVKLPLSAGETLGSAATPEIVQVYRGPVWLELWSFDADTSWYLERQREGREGQRVITEQRINSGPVSRRIARVADNERVTVRAWARAVSSNAGWNDTTGRYTASNPAPYIQVLTYNEEPYEYGASSANAVILATDASETIVAAHHARYLTVYAHAAAGDLEILDRAGTVVALRPLTAVNVINCADAWTRVRITSRANTDIAVTWIATVNAPGML